MKDSTAHPFKAISDDTRGRLVARVLSASWRKAASGESISEHELKAIAPLLYESGGAALAWWRIRDSALANSETGLSFRETYKLSRLRSLIDQSEIEYVFSLLRAKSIEPILVKGWAIARLYPERGLRPYGDIDLCVRPDQFEQAQAALKCLEDLEGHCVDLHKGFSKLEGRRAHLISPPFGRGLRGGFERHKPSPQPSPKGRGSKQSPLTLGEGPGVRVRSMWDELFERSQLVDLGEEKIRPSPLGEGSGVRVARTMVRVLSDEDHLRVLCLHLLRSGAWRPLWLCDVALAVESRAANFDWDICLGKDRRQADSVACTVGLAQQLLGVEKFAIRNSQFEIPGWLVPAVLRQWNRCVKPDAAGMALPTLLANATEPKKLFSEIYARWDNPVRSTVALSGRFNNWPRLPYQLAELITHSHEVPKQLRTMLRGWPASLRPNAAELRPLTSDL